MSCKMSETEHISQAFAYLDTFRHRYPTFNDDIQGTGAVVLSGFLNAAKLSSAASVMTGLEDRIDRENIVALTLAALRSS